MTLMMLPSDHDSDSNLTVSDHDSDSDVDDVAV